MSIIDIWQSSPKELRESYVIPDGYQDVIIVRKPGIAPYIYLSPLYCNTIKVSLTADTSMMGFRLQPGSNFSRLSMTCLEQSIDSKEIVTDIIESSTFTDIHVAEALACIREYGQSIQYCAEQLGVSSRTLQRLLSKHTTRSPTFWLQLARVRRCALELSNNGVHPDIAYQCHYSDQAHMCREIKQWFGVTPSQLVTRTDLTEQLYAQAY